MTLNRWPYNTVSFKLLMIGIALIMWLICATVSIAGAASLRICFNPTDPATTAVRAYLDQSPLYEDILASSVQQSRCVGGPVSGELCTAPSTCQTGQCITQRCSLNPIPPTIARGRSLAVTLRGVNILAEEGPASAPVTFSAPAIPGQVQGVAVQLVAPTP